MLEPVSYNGSMNICGGEKYTIGNNTIALPVKINNLPETFKVNEHTLLGKSEYHVSLVALGKIAKGHDVRDGDEFYKKATDLFCKYVEHRDVSLEKYRNEFRFAKVGDKKTLVVMCDISGLDGFLDEFNREFNLSVEYPPTHVTIYTLQPGKAIWLVTSEDIENLTEIVSGEEIYNFL